MRHEVVCVDTRDTLFGPCNGQKIFNHVGHVLVFGHDGTEQITGWMIVRCILQRELCRRTYDTQRCAELVARIGNESLLELVCPFRRRNKISR